MSKQVIFTFYLIDPSSYHTDDNDLFKKLSFRNSLIFMSLEVKIIIHGNTKVDNLLLQRTKPDKSE